MDLIGGGMIGNYNYIGTCMNGLIQNQPPKELNPFQFLQKLYINNKDRTAHFVGHSKLKELDIDDFYERKQTNDKMEAEMSEMDVKHRKNAYSEDANVDEAIPTQIRKERTTEAYKETMNQNIENIATIQM